MRTCRLIRWRRSLRRSRACLSVQVWDKSNVTPVEKAIRAMLASASTPITDGQNIRLPIPDMTEERRKELVKLAH